MNPILHQMRDAFGITIGFNASSARWFVYPTKDNGSGILISDFTKVPVVLSEQVRLTHESSLSKNGNIPVGLGTSFSTFVEAKYNSNLRENDIMVVNGQGWKVGPLDSLKVVAGDCYGKRAPLTLVTLSKDCVLYSIAVGEEEGTISGQAALIILPLGTDVTSLTPTITHTGKMVTPSGAQDFTEPVLYTILAEDMSYKQYVVTVEVV